jgi:hypothetical protein
VQAPSFGRPRGVVGLASVWTLRAPRMAPQDRQRGFLERLHRASSRLDDAAAFLEHSSMDVLEVQGELFNGRGRQVGARPPSVLGDKMSPAGHGG